MADGTVPPRPPVSAFAPLDYGLYAAVVAIWGTSWLPLHMQLGVVAPEVSLVWRFALAAAIMLVWTALRGERLRFPLADHARFALLGATIFSSNFLMFYYGGLTTPSGLLAVVFSLASVFNILLGALLLGTRPSPRVAVAALLGFGGVALMFSPQLAGASLAGPAMHGLLFCLAGTTLFCLGNIVSVANRRRGLPIAPATAWGMVYGTLFLILVSLVRHQPFIVEPTARYLGALVWSSVLSSVLAFAAYMTLLARIGADRAGYSTVMYPVIALGVSTLFEGYVWTAPAVAGLALVLVGNGLVLTKGR